MQPVVSGVAGAPRRFRGHRTIRDLVTPWHVVGALVIAGLAALIWYLGQVLWGQPGGTLLTVVGVVCYLALIVKDMGIRLAFLATAAICISAVPFLYVLLLFLQLPSVVFGLTPFHVHAYFVRPLHGALVGAAVGFLAFRERAESMADEILPKLGDGAGGAISVADSTQAAARATE